MNIKQKVKAIKSGKLTALENLQKFTNKIKKENRELNIFLSLNEDAEEQAQRIDEMIKNGDDVGKLVGICFALKSNIACEEMETNCGSKVLEGYISPFTATAVEKLLSEGAILVGMVNMDEFACGASGETSAFGKTLNPRNKKLIPGGSSSGSASAVAGEFCDFALGSDTGGSIRNPASHCGVVGLKPTYGAVSRYGLLDMCMSFDVIGPLTNSVEDTELIFDIIKGQDNFDNTTKEFPKIKSEIKTIGLVDVSKFCDEKIANLIKEKTEEIAKKNKWKIKQIELPLDIALQTYYVLVYTEFYSATRKYDGRRFGLAIDKFGGPEVQRRILGGSEITKAEFEGKYYREALKAKQFVKEQFEKLFAEIDLIIMPTVPKLPHEFGTELSVEEMYGYDVLTTIVNIAGIPAISVPAGKIDGKDVGLQILAPYFHEKNIFEFGKEVE